MEQLTRGHARDVKTLFTLIDTDNSGSCEQVSWEVAEEIWGSFQIYWAQKPKGPLLLKPILGPKEAIQHINYQVLEVAREEMTSLRSLFDSWYEHRQFNDVLSPAPPGILSIRSVAVELRHAIDRMQRRNSWPRFLLESKDKGPAQQLSSEEGYFETGNLVWENLYWLGGRLPTGTGIVADVERNARVPTDEYGTGSNKSSKGILMLT
ncbi:unnamed protein product, partial [Symbiodinium microadriaticum]